MNLTEFLQLTAAVALANLIGLATSHGIAAWQNHRDRKRAQAAMEGLQSKLAQLGKRAAEECGCPGCVARRELQARAN